MEDYIITRSGYKKLMDELFNLTSVERPRVVEIVSWAAGNGDRSENGDYIYGRQQLRKIDRRIQYLDKVMTKPKIVDPDKMTNTDQVFFGATVTVDSEKRGKFTLKIVGVDEILHDSINVSYKSPIAKALWKSSVGDVVTVETPSGFDEVEIIDIVYK